MLQIVLRLAAAALLLADGGAQSVAPPSPSQTAPASPQPLTLHVQEMQQHATVMVPPPAPAATVEVAAPAVRRPAIVVLHSGFSGDESTSAAIARELTRLGFVTVMPTYRGERRALDGARSEGSIEFCSGEVDDVQRVLAWLRSRPDVDPMRIGLFGMSHGGCVALRTAIREPRIRAVATIAAPVAAEAVFEHLVTNPYQFFFYNGILAQQIRSYVDGPGRPDTPPGSFAVRSPLFLASKLTMPVMLLHGSSDHIVPPQQACWMAQALQRSGRSVEEKWLGKDGSPLASPQLRCRLDASPPASQSSSSAGPPRPRTELWLIQGQDHIFFSAAAKKSAQAKAMQFLQQELGAAAQASASASTRIP